MRITSVLRHSLADDFDYLVARSPSHWVALVQLPALPHVLRRAKYGPEPALVSQLD